ncbi:MULTISPECIES: PQQ-dependent sugar dehydrogenase [unclassified Caulobacter]|uniref:PQQ-dependent sugar dehydrogenase n=1 Tax=unclassified Caulobacter TaxID=2648921 RepID=UPI000D3AB0ED|nr:MULTISPECIES: PQQ-dependent sugar dehydrogenase [unclassified Caulobacter]PTS89507.1 hypothetical protein DBR21_06225 [Caulobacter sp. HMWF009]PTT06540.1 hypothetical protein DBR10_12345 [Caulobacter sp. HMWF025]PTT71250.1 hypothetical protein DBR41_30620 [Pseudomonas sp. HMWF010]
MKRLIFAAIIFVIAFTSATAQVILYDIGTADSQYYSLSIKRWKLIDIRDDGVSGPFSLVGSKYVFINRCGLQTVGSRVGDSFTMAKGVQVPTPPGKSIACDFQGSLGGVKGFLTDPARGVAYLAYHFRPGSPDCVKLAVVRYTLSGETLSAPKTLFETDPCYSEHIAALTQAGGSFAMKPDGVLYFGVGDFGGMVNAQMDDQAYGKIYRYDPRSGEVAVLAKGVRNPQGLSWAGGSLYESEHGPKGGDEINIVHEGDNLGWPVDSLGAAYNRDIYGDDPLDAGFIWGHSTISKSPAFAYVPSIAPTGIAAYPTGSQFGKWGGDLLVVAIGARTLNRVRFEDGRGIYSEPLINTGERLRFIQIARDGAIYIKADPDLLIEVRRALPPKATAPAVPYTAAQVEFGKRAYSDNCAGCHGGRLEGASARTLTGGGMSSFTVQGLHNKVQSMPLTAPHSLPVETSAAITAYLLKFNCHPPAPGGAFPVDPSAQLGAITVSKSTCS